MSDIYIQKVVEKPKEPTGYICITDQVRIAVYKPINRFHRFMMNRCFGWEYKENENEDNNNRRL